MMKLIWLRLREVVWTSVLSLVLAALAVVCGFTGAFDLTMGFGLSAIATAILSIRD